MDVSDEERRDAENTGELICKKLLEIMDLQGYIDALIRNSIQLPSDRPDERTPVQKPCIVW